MGERLDTSAEKDPLAPLRTSDELAIVVKELSEVPILNQAPWGALAVFTPVNEADRVAPVALTLLAEPTDTVPVWAPGVPPPDGSQSV